ncbi:hypothetical protein DT019_29085 [Streptomyces sp. SDr-06]|nr:hypothetical protein DT019_29085 [Streptomyces sp. SDr-06]
MQEARTAHAHAHRVKRLEGQPDAWHQTKRLTEYVTAVPQRRKPTGPTRRTVTCKNERLAHHQSARQKGLACVGHASRYRP